MVIKKKIFNAFFNFSKPSKFSKKFSNSHGTNSRTFHHLTHCPLVHVNTLLILPMLLVNSTYGAIPLVAPPSSVFCVSSVRAQSVGHFQLSLPSCSLRLCLRGMEIRRKERLLCSFPRQCWNRRDAEPLPLFLSVSLSSDSFSSFPSADATRFSEEDVMFGILNSESARFSMVFECFRVQSVDLDVIDKKTADSFPADMVYLSVIRRK